MKIIRLIGASLFGFGFFMIVFIGIPWHIYQEPELPWWFKVAFYMLMLGVLIVLLAVVIGYRGSKEKANSSNTNKSLSPILIHNPAKVPGYDITKALGLVRGHTIFAVSLGRDLAALMRLITGGELVEYTEMIGQARKTAVERMILEAEEIKADAIINVRFVTTAFVTGAAELMAYGTALKLTKNTRTDKEKKLLSFT